jgi:hypothetical protein
MTIWDIYTGKRKSDPATRHGGTWGERRYSSYSFITSALDGVWNIYNIHILNARNVFVLLPDIKPQSTPKPFIKADITKIRHNQCQYTHPTSQSTIYIYIYIYKYIYVYTPTILQTATPKKAHTTENGYTRIVSQSGNNVHTYIHYQQVNTSILRCACCVIDAEGYKKHIV